MSALGAADDPTRRSAAARSVVRRKPHRGTSVVPTTFRRPLRKGNRDGLEHGAGAAGSGGTQAKPPSRLIEVGLNDLIEVADDIGPFALAAGGDETVV